MNIEQIREKFKGAYVSSYEKAQKNYNDEYLSHRNDENVSLVRQELNILTVEDYDKWYGLYYLMEDPDTKEVMLVTLALGDILEGIDHEFYPNAVVKFCIENDIKIDITSYICICKSLFQYDENILDMCLPHMNDLYKVISTSDSNSFTFNVYGKYDNPYGYAKGVYINEER